MSKFETKELFSFSEICDMSNHDLVIMYSKLKCNFQEHLTYDKEQQIFKLTTFAPLEKGESDHITINGYYELPDGTIVNICRSDNLRRKVDYTTDYGSGCQEATFKEVKSWKRRGDLIDYPNSSNPKLPHTFDLLWDIKYESELRTIMQDGYSSDDIDEIYNEVKNHPHLLKKFKHYIW